MNLTSLNVTQALKGLAGREFNAVELAKSYLEAIEQADCLNAFITRTSELALAMAESSDRRRAAGEQLGELEGIPLAVKDVFCTKDILTTAASHILDRFVPPYESTVTKQLWQAGAVLLGKTNLDEFAMGSANVSSYYGCVINPWSKGPPGKWERPLVPGGSSGGSAAAVAAHCAAAAIGTDTGGSIRQPASLCGLVGIKPTYGRCSRWGIVAFASSLDQAGALTRCVRDAAVMLKAMAGFDSKDATCANLPVPDYLSDIEQSIQGLKVGIPKEYHSDDLPQEIVRWWHQGADWLRSAGAEIVEVSLPHTRYALATYYIVAPAEASSNLARYDGIRYGLRVEGQDLREMYENTRGQGFGPEVRRRILIGTYVLSSGYYEAYYLKAQKVRSLIANDFHQVFEHCHAILTPTSPSEAFAIGESLGDPVAMYFNDVFTVPASLAGLPAVSVPVGLGERGLPLGLQLIGTPFNESTILGLAQRLEDAAGPQPRPSFLVSAE